MEKILAAATVIGALVSGVTLMIKQTTIHNKWLPFLNVGVGILLGVGYALTISHTDVFVYAWAGAIAGMAAGGFYDMPAGVIKSGEEKHRIDPSDVDNEFTDSAIYPMERRDDKHVK